MDEATRAPPEEPRRRSRLVSCRGDRGRFRARPARLTDPNGSEASTSADPGAAGGARRPRLTLVFTRTSAIDLAYPGRPGRPAASASRVASAPGPGGPLESTHSGRSNSPDLHRHLAAHLNVEGGTPIRVASLKVRKSVTGDVGTESVPGSGVDRPPAELKDARAFTDIRTDRAPRREDLCIDDAQAARA
jgi:hypothetical protein